jgi:uncharacterized protein (TIGR03083 family)
MDDAKTWDLIHRERAATVDTLAELTPEQWGEPSLCHPWSVEVTAAHIVMGAEQTKAKFMSRMLANGFRFNRMMDVDARRLAAQPHAEIVDRLRATTSTTNGPPAPVLTMLGEIVVHSDDIRRPLGLESRTDPDAVVACLEMYRSASFPLGSKKRIAGLRLVATDVDWEHGTGPEVSGPGLALVMTMTGRSGALNDLTGEGLAVLTDRMAPTAV